MLYPLAVQGHTLREHSLHFCLDIFHSAHRTTTTQHIDHVFPPRAARYPAEAGARHTDKKARQMQQPMSNGYLRAPVSTLHRVGRYVVLSETVADMTAVVLVAAASRAQS